MNQLVGYMLFVKVYLDDVLIFSRKVEEHVEHIRQVVELVASHGLKLKISKYEFAKKSVSLLGHVVSTHGVQVDDSKLLVIKDTTRPRSSNLLGVTSYYQRFIKGFTSISAPLHVLKSSKKVVIWTEEACVAFAELKQAMMAPPVLAFPDFEKPFVVKTDTSSTAVGAVLCQQDANNKIHSIQYASKTMSTAEMKYYACEREAFVVIFAIRKFWLFLLSSHQLTVFTNQQALKAAFTWKDIHVRLA